jgi:hypothetical protein
MYPDIEHPATASLPLSVESYLALDYRGYDGFPVRTQFRFTDGGKIRLTACEPIKAAA